MNPERLRVLETLLKELSHVPETARESRLAEIGDQELRAELLTLLESRSESSTISAAIAGVAHAATAIHEAPAQLGPWRITGILGFGGMGAVYRAVRADSAYEKEVAIKVLHTVLELPVVKERFRQERQILANLEHPNIARMLDGGETTDGHSYIVMECVHGEDIASYCRHHKLSLKEKLGLLLPVCAAVQEAHRNHIIHRDLKPANILVTETGAPKLLDFGIAKWLEGRSPPTQLGLQPLTPQYASPEQIRGGPLSAATDVYSLGAVLYELLTGARAQQRVTTTDAIPETPCPTRIVPGFDKTLAAILLKALETDPRRRYASAEEFAADIARYLEHQPVQARPATSLTRAMRRVRRRLPLISGLALVAAAVTAVGVRGFRNTTPPSPAKPLTSAHGNQRSPSFSPDGSQVVFSWEGEGMDNRDLYVTAREGGPSLRRITTDPAVDEYPAWSPDGRHIAFVRGGAWVMVLSLADLSERKIAETDGRFVSWTHDGRAVLFAKSNGDTQTFSIYQVDSASGEQRRLTDPGERADIFEPALVSPDGKYIGYARRAGIGAAPELYVRPLAGGTAKQLTKDRASILGWSWMPNSREIVFASKRIGTFHTLWRIGVSGWNKDPIAVPETAHAAYPTVAGTGNGVTAVAYERWSRHGGLLEAQLLSGKPEPALDSRQARSIAPSTGLDSSPRISPDGNWVAFVSDRSGFDEIWRSDKNGRDPTVLTSFGANGYTPGSPYWSPDSQQIVLDVKERDHSNIYVISAQGGTPRRVTAWQSSDQYRPSWSADGRSIYFGSNLQGGGIWKAPATAIDARPGQAIAVAKDGFEGRESPDGSILYYYRSVAGGKGELLGNPVGGGPTIAAQGIVTAHGWWTVGKKGIYFLNMQSPPAASKADTRWPVAFLSFNTQRVSWIGDLYGQLSLYTPDFCVSPDEQRLLYGRLEFANTNIMLIDRLQ